MKAPGGVVCSNSDKNQIHAEVKPERPLWVESGLTGVMVDVDYHRPLRG